MRRGVLMKSFYWKRNILQNAPPHSPLSFKKTPCHPEWAVPERAKERWNEGSPAIGSTSLISPIIRRCMYQRIISSTLIRCRIWFSRGKRQIFSPFSAVITEGVPGPPVVHRGLFTFNSFRVAVLWAGSPFRALWGNCTYLLSFCFDSLQDTSQELLKGIPHGAWPSHTRVRFHSEWQDCFNGKGGEGRSGDSQKDYIIIADSIESPLLPSPRHPQMPFSSRMNRSQVLRGTGEMRDLLFEAGINN